MSITYQGMKGLGRLKHKFFHIKQIYKSLLGYKNCEMQYSLDDYNIH